MLRFLIRPHNRQSVVSSLLLGINLVVSSLQPLSKLSQRLGSLQKTFLQCVKVCKVRSSHCLTLLKDKLEPALMALRKKAVVVQIRTRQGSNLLKVNF